MKGFLGVRVLFFLFNPPIPHEDREGIHEKGNYNERPDDPLVSNITSGSENVLGIEGSGATGSSSNTPQSSTIMVINDSLLYLTSNL